MRKSVGRALSVGFPFRVALWGLGHFPRGVEVCERVSLRDWIQDRSLVHLGASLNVSGFLSSLPSPFSTRLGVEEAVDV